MTYLYNKKFSNDSNEMRDLASRICRDYLNGAWKSVTPQNIGFKHISGGLSNLLYHISLPEELIKLNKNPDEPTELLLRIYGQTHGEHAVESLITDSVIFTLLSERGLGPKLHGIFPGGRLEQYINARPLLTKELSDEILSKKIAQKMAAIHNMEVPLHKEAAWLWNTIERWIKTCNKKTNQIPDYLNYLKTINLHDEMNWLKLCLEAENCPVVFCHNDMQEGNILLCQNDKNNNEQVIGLEGEVEENDRNVVLIDFEYCSYNYRSFDIANHFVEWIYDYTFKIHPFFKEDINNYPNDKQRLHFINSYLNELDSNEDPIKVLKEVDVFTLASHLFWGLWGVINADVSQIPFGYWEYAASRFKHYFHLKEKFITNSVSLNNIDGEIEINVGKKRKYSLE